MFDHKTEVKYITCNCKWIGSRLLVAPCGIRLANPKGGKSPGLACRKGPASTSPQPSPLRGEGAAGEAAALTKRRGDFARRILWGATSNLPGTRAISSLEAIVMGSPTGARLD